MSLSKYRLIMWAIVAVGLYAILALTVPAATLIAILNGVFLGVAVAVVIVYAPLVFVTIFKYRFDRVSQLSVGIALLWLSAIAQRFWSFWFRYNGSPKAWLNSYSVSAITYMAIIAGGLFVTAPGFPQDIQLKPIQLWGANHKLLLVLGSIGGISTFVFSVYPGVNF